MRIWFFSFSKEVVESIADAFFIKVDVEFELLETFAKYSFSIHSHVA